MILPGEVVVPGPPGRLRDRQSLLAHEAEVADRDGARAVGRGATIGISEGVELLQVAKRMAGLPLDPCAQPALQGPVPDLERTGRQRPPALDRHGEGRPVRNRDQHGDQFDRDRLRRRPVRRLPPIHFLPRHRHRDWV